MGSPKNGAVRTREAATSAKLPATSELKSQARRLRRALDELVRHEGPQLSHSQSLELVAKLWGRRDWNTLNAAASAGREQQRAEVPSAVPWRLGSQVTGTAFGKPFEGRLIGMSLFPTPDRVRVAVHLDDPVDVVDFESFSSERHRLVAIVSTENGRSLRRRSDGAHQLTLDLPSAVAESWTDEAGG